MSYGINAPQGLVPRRYFNNAPWNNATEVFEILPGAGAIYAGDPVFLQADGTIIQATNIVAPFAGPTQLLGVFAGCQYQIPNALASTGTIVNSPYWPGPTTIAPNTTVKAYVITDPSVVFDIQTTAAGGLASTAVGSTATYAIGAGSTATGQSTTSLNALVAPGSAGNFMPLIVIGLTPVPNNRWSVGGNFEYNNVEVMLNATIFKYGTAGV